MDDAVSFSERNRTAARSFSLLEDKGDDLQPLPFSLVRRIVRPAVLFSEMAGAHAAAIHQMTVSLMHTALGLLLGDVDHLIHQSLDALIFLRIRPASCLYPVKCLLLQSCALSFPLLKYFPRHKKTANTNVYGLSQVPSLRHFTPRVGLEPTTTRLTAECSTIELSGIIQSN